MFNKHLLKIVHQKDLSQEEMAQMIGEILSGNVTDAQIGGFMAALSTKGETFEELAGATQAMRRKALRIDVPLSTLVDTCGTGGDGAKTFNISTTTAFVVAGCDVPVAKHGNRSVSSQCGSADLLEALGLNLELNPESVEEAICELGIGFLYAPLYHSAMRYAANARKEVGIRSIFNMLGPLTNPAGARCQLLGVYDARLTEMFAKALKSLGTKRAFVVHGHDGLDEISVCEATRISELKDGLIRTYDIRPEDFFGQRAASDDLSGGDAKENAIITNNILKGEKGPKRNIILLNASAALVAAEKAADFNEGIKMAKESIDSGKAYDKLNALIRFTNEEK